MTQDQADQAQGTGAAGGQVIHDDETGASQAEESGAVTRLKKVASALRGDRPDQAAPGQTVSDETIPDPATPDEMAITDRGTQNPDGTVNSAVAPDDMTDPEYASAARPADAGTAAGDVGTVPSSAPAGRYDQDGEQNVTAGARDEDVAAADPTLPGSATYDTTAATGRTDPAPEYGNQGGTAAGYESQGGTAPAPSSFPGTTPEDGSPAETSSGFASEAGTANGYGSPVGTGTDPQDLTGSTPVVTGTGATDPLSTEPVRTEPVTGGLGTTGPDATEPGAAGSAVAGSAGAGPEVAGSAAAGAAGRDAADDAGLRPGEATDRLGDFGDIAFGNLLPDADQFTAQWQEIQFRFVDDPQGSVTEAAEVITQVTSKLEAAIRERQQAIEDRQRAIQERASALRGRWGEGSNADTETLRETLRMYRSFMDQLVGPTP
jgi:hypothetical protein